jgi:YbbR domain-containing protein
MGHKIMHALFDNLGLKIVSLVIAFVIWLLVSNADNPTRTILYSNVPITIVNQDSVADIGKVVEPEGSGTVTLRVTDRRSVLQTLARNGSDFYVEADMENLNEMNTVPLTVTCSNSSVTWDKIQMLPSSLKVILENKVEQTFVASVSTEGSPAGGYEVGSTSVEEGKNIVIAGPESLMRIINQVVAPVNVAGLAEDSTLSSTLRVYDKNGSVLTDAQMSRLEFKNESGTVLADHMVTVNVALWKIRTDLPIIVRTSGTPMWGYRVSEIDTIPASISVSGTDEALAALGNGFEVIDEIDVSGARESVTAEIDLTNTLSEMTGIKLIAGADPTVQVEVLIEQNGDVTLEVPLSAISLSNRPENMALVFTPADVLPVSVHALDESAQRLVQEQIGLSLDLSQCANEGSYELPVEVALPDGYELASPVTIKVSSTKTEKQSEAEEQQIPAP